LIEEEINIEEIEELSEKVLAKYSTTVPVDPHEIAKRVGLRTFFEPYDKLFHGNTVFVGNKFLVLLNKNNLSDLNYPFARYTYAHELGHYFIPKHRNNIRKGKSYAFSGGRMYTPEKKIVEREANQFAASLLMPRTLFSECYDSFDNLSFETILHIKDYFNVSITTAAIRLNKLNLTPCITIIWNKDGIKGKGVSKKFLELFGNKYPIEIKINTDRPLIEEEKIYYEPNDIEYEKAITVLSSWTNSIPKDIANQFLVIEETHKHQYGNFTLIRPLNN